MKAWRVARHGGPEVLEHVDVKDPVPGPLEAKVRVDAVGLNHLDIWVRKGVPGHHFPLPMIPGCDVAGQIVGFGELGPGAEIIPGFSKGTEVLVNPGLSCGRCEACLSGLDPLCKDYGILGETRDGACAEFVVVPITNLIARPKNLSAAQAASLPIPFLTAWTMLTRKAELRPGELVLIQAGGSGVSIAAIQIAKLLGAEVITTVGSDAKIEKARALGADHVINYRKESFRDVLKKISPRGVDVVIDHVGQTTFADSLRCLAWGGRLVTCGATSGAEIKLNLNAIFFKNISILGSTMGSKGDLIRIVDLVARGKLKPVIDSEFSMSALPDAHAYLETRQAFGKVVVTR